MLLQGKKGVILGVANQRSIAWGVTEAILKQGAEVCFAVQTDRFKDTLSKMLEPFGKRPVFTCDVSQESSILEFRDNVQREFGNIDFLVHSVAYANKEDLVNEFYKTEKDGFLRSLDISAYSFVSLCRAFQPIVNQGGSLFTLTYVGSTKTILNYNMMGISKAALEACVRYLATDFGKQGVRVNALSAGPVQTLAARGIRGFSNLLKIHSKIAPLRRPTTLEDIGGAGVFLCSDLSAGMSSEVIFVDGGYHNVAVGDLDAYNLS